MTYKRRWRGFTAEQVSERMTMIRTKRFKTKEDEKKHARVMVDARGVWIEKNGKRKYVRRTK